MMAYGGYQLDLLSQLIIHLLQSFVVAVTARGTDLRYAVTPSRIALESLSQMSTVDEPLLLMIEILHHPLFTYIYIHTIWAIYYHNSYSFRI